MPPLNSVLKTNWKLLSIIVVILLAGGFFAWQYFGMSKEEGGITEKGGITLNSLKNTEYYFPTYKKLIRLTDGQYEDYSAKIFAQIYDNKIAFGDLNNDGKEDAAIIVTISGGGSGNFRELAVMENRSGKPVYVDSVQLGDRTIINSVSIDSGIITVDMVSVGPGDPACCPTKHEIYDFKAYDNKLLLEPVDWQTYRDEEFGFEMKYPAELKFQEGTSRFTLSHSVEYAHKNPCDFIGDGSVPPLEKLTDFSMQGEMLAMDLITSVKSKSGSYLIDNFIKEDTLQEDPGFIDIVTVGELSGYRITSGAEGCGTRTYYLSLSENTTLRLQIPLPLEGLYNASTLNEAGAFSSQQSEKLYSEVLSKVQFIGAEKATDWQTYRNEEYGFEVKYPSNFTASNTKSGGQILEDPNNPNNGRMIIELLNLKFDEVIKNIPVKDIENTTLGGKEAIYYSLGEHNQLNKYYKVKANENQTIEIFVISTEYGSLSFDKQTELFNQMLSTFRFLE